MYNQMGAVTRRKLNPNYVDSINRQAPLLFRQRQIDDNTAFQNKEFAQNQANFERNLALSQEGLDWQKKQAKKANRLGYATIGANLIGGVAQNYGNDVYNAAKDELAIKTAKPVIDTAKNLSGDVLKAGASQVVPFQSETANSGIMDAVKKLPGQAYDIAGQGLSAIYSSAISPVIEWAFGS